MRIVFVSLLGVATGLWGGPAARGQGAGVEFFEKKIRPVLVEHCYECHAAAAKKVRGGLRLDSRAALIQGGESGPAVVPGHPEKSLLIKAVRHQDGERKMPPKGKLSAAAIEDLEAWIAMGAPDPRSAPAPPGLGAIPDHWSRLVEERKRWWSLQPLKKVAPPTNDAAHTIDRFLQAQLAENGLTLAPSAAPQTLLRRLSLILTGLPPTPEEIVGFERQIARQSLAEAARAQTDRLLASPHFGERWARHWMDVVRFSETHGNEWNYEVPYAWRYRDYLIRAFNADVPYDQLIREHIAGDLLPSPRWNAAEKFNESIIGTAFWRFGEVNHDDCISLRTIGYDLADNQIDTLTKGFQAMTVACARCHDHKLDAISMRDYYGLLGVVRSSRCVSHTIDAPDVNADLIAAMQKAKRAVRRELAELWRREAQADLAHRLAKRAPAKAPEDHPFALWAQVAEAMKANGARFSDAFSSVIKRLQQKEATRTASSTDYLTLADFRSEKGPGWQFSGQALRDRTFRPGDLVITAAGDRAVFRLLPAGCFTHRLSEKLNGAVRSPVLTSALTANKKRISLRVLGERTSAVRLVSNNCQLNYQNYRALTSDQWQWITFTLPDDLDSLNVYAELMTKFDNPKFPDPLGTLGGDTKNERVPWHEAAKDARSYFGVAEVVLHDTAEPPKPALASLLDAFHGSVPKDAAELAEVYTRRLSAALEAWSDERARDADVTWLRAFLEHGLLSNSLAASPRLTKLVAEYSTLEGQLSLPRIVPGLAESGLAYDQPIFGRGDCFKPGPLAPRRFVEVVSPRPFAAAGSGRLELAEQIASRNNPLTARVMVNRIWHHLFGAGLVRTVDDFGHVGERPSHPELLDWLATRFMDDGWSVKRLIRTIVDTQAFQAAHEPSAAALEVDPENRLLQHYPARRMEAEAIRDSLLTVSGRLERLPFGPSIPAHRAADNVDRRLFRGPVDGQGRRSIYIKVTLMEAPAFLEAFNIPGGKVTQGRRDVSQTPAQALALLNDPFVRDQAEVWSQRLLRDQSRSMDERVVSMFRAALGRGPNEAERTRFAVFVEKLAEAHEVARDSVMASRSVWRDAAHAFFNLQEFVTIP